MRKTTRFLALVLVLMLVMCLMCACNFVEVSNADEPEATAAPEPVESETPSIDNSNAESFETVYGEVLYPDELENLLRIEESNGGGDDDNSGYSVSFYATFNDEEYLLYKVNYGIEEGFEVGKLKTDDGDVTVYGYISDIEFDDSWTQEDIDSFCAMQESINNVLQSIREYPNFSE